MEHPLITPCVHAHSVDFVHSRSANSELTLERERVRELEKELASAKDTIFTLQAAKDVQAVCISASECF